MRQASIAPVASCFMLGLNDTDVTVSLWPLKCLSNAGSSWIKKKEQNGILLSAHQMPSFSS